jgi:hypothetical protein
LEYERGQGEELGAMKKGVNWGKDKRGRATLCWPHFSNSDAESDFVNAAMPFGLQFLNSDAESEF